jgi:hypothetical protein
MHIEKTETTEQDHKKKEQYMVIDQEAQIS